MRQGVRLGIDVGTARVGVARSDRDGLLATPVETIQRTDVPALVARVSAIVDELDAFEIIVGLPLSLSGRDTRSTDDARAIAAELALLRPARLVDERLSTVTASAGMRASGRRAKTQRSQIDQAAAVVILQHALDTERARDVAPGTLVEVGQRPAETRGS